MEDRAMPREFEDACMDDNLEALKKLPLHLLNDTSMVGGEERV
jgi:hypothetical protein